MFDAGLPVTTVLADRPCAGLALAEERGAAAELVDRQAYGGFGPDFDREGFTTPRWPPRWWRTRSTWSPWPASAPS